MGRQEELVDRIHATPHKGVIYTAGGGSGIFPILMRRGGASATILDGGIPHGELAVPKYLGLDLSRPERFPKAVSSEVARGLAMAAYREAKTLDAAGPHFGVGCTVSLAKNVAEREGREHWVFLSGQTATRTLEYNYKFPEKDTRENQETAVENWLLNMVATVCDVCPFVPVCLCETFESCGHSKLPLLINNQIPNLAYSLVSGDRPTQASTQDFKYPFSLFCGSFNPCHAGHKKIRKVAAEILGVPCHLELCVRNADKPPLDYIEIGRRLDSIGANTEDGDNGLLTLTTAGTFLQKSALFPNTWFCVGYDTAMRIMDPRFYSCGRDAAHPRGEARFRNRDFKIMEERGAKFLVFGRVDSAGVFRNLDLDDPKSFPDKSAQEFFKRNARVVEEWQFREDVSSTQIRGTV